MRIYLTSCLSVKQRYWKGKIPREFLIAVWNKSSVESTRDTNHPSVLTLINDSRQEMFKNSNLTVVLRTNLDFRLGNYRSTLMSDIYTRVTRSPSGETEETREKQGRLNHKNMRCVRNDPQNRRTVA